MPAIKYSAQRVAVLIDTQNLYHSAKNLYRAKVNFKNVLEDIVGDRTLIRAMAYVVATEGGEERAFFDALEKNGIETKTKNLQVFAGGAKKGDWDVGLAIDAVKIAEKADAIVIVSGDGDFVPLIEYLKAKGVQAEAAAFGRSTSARLIEAAEDFFDFDENPRRYLIGPVRAMRGTPRRRTAGAAGDNAEKNADSAPEFSEAEETSVVE